MFQFYLRLSNYAGLFDGWLQIFWPAAFPFSGKKTQGKSRKTCQPTAVENARVTESTQCCTCPVHLPPSNYCSQDVHPVKESSLTLRRCMTEYWKTRSFDVACGLLGEPYAEDAPDASDEILSLGKWHDT